MPSVDYRSLPFAEAIAFFREKTAMPTERWTDVWKQAHDSSWMVAGATKADLLSDLRAAVDEAISEGTTLEQFRQRFDETVQKHGWNYRGSRGWRTRVIYETNLRAAYQAGRHAQLTDPDLLQSRPYWEYRHGGSADPREEHLAWDGMVLPADDPWWDSHYPPNGWGCSCKVIARSEDDLRRLGKDVPDRAPTTSTYTWTDPATGEVHSVPEGIDPGWDYAPGATVDERTRAAVRRKEAKLPPGIARSLERQIRRRLREDPDPFEGDR